jgi:hypothetical protein
VTPFPAEFAADGIDELIMGFFGRREQPVADGQRTLRVVAADAGADWLVTMAADGSDVAPSSAARPVEATAVLATPTPR